ncbi:hypothetical protein M434DRAFT_83422 [Hypoxylon sp. CO27-5]|nr:hypothetical protein M434DRAFT_83422 [Hypoxylon sp. CO27-5]
MTPNLGEVSYGDIGPHDADLEHKGRATSIDREAIAPHHDNPAYGLQWTNDDNPFSTRAEWTVVPTIDSIVLTLKKFINQSKEYHVQHLWDGVYSKLYSVSYEEKHYVMRVSLPVCPQSKTESEVATLNLIHKNTRLPVPTVICYDSTRNNPIGFEWILMDRIDGKPLSQCWQAVTQNAKERIVKQVAEYAVIAFRGQFEGVGNIYPPRSHLASGSQHVGEMGGRASLHHHKTPFRTAFQWTKCRLRLVSTELRLKLQETTSSEGHRETAAKMLNLAIRLRELGRNFFPTPDCEPNRELVDEDDELTDDGQDEDEEAVNKKDRPHEPTMLWHDAISLDNIIVDKDGVLCGIIDWACVSCLPLYEACQFPAFLQQARDRHVGPLTPHRVTQRQPDSKDILGYERDLRQHELTLLRKLFINEMMGRCPEWVHIYNNRKNLRDYEAAVQNCDNEFAYGIVERWVDAVEKGGTPDATPWRLHERLM